MLDGCTFLSHWVFSAAYVQCQPHANLKSIIADITKQNACYWKCPIGWTRTASIANAVDVRFPSAVLMFSASKHRTSIRNIVSRGIPQLFFIFMMYLDLIWYTNGYIYLMLFLLHINVFQLDR